MTLRVAHVSKYCAPHPGGAESQLQLLAPLLARRMLRCDIVATRQRSDHPACEWIHGVQVRRLRSAGTQAELAAGFSYFLRWGHRYDVVHGHCLSAFVLGAITAARLRGCRTVLKTCAAGLNGEVAKIRRRAMGELLWAAFRKCDAFVVQTPQLAQELRAHGVEGRRIWMIPGGLSADREPARSGTERAEARRGLGLPECLTVLFAGRMVAQKGVEVLVRGWPSVVQRVHANLVLLGDGELSERLDCLAMLGGAGDLIHRMGWQPDVRPYYRAADIFAFPAREEAFGNVLAEAMANGLGVVTRPTGLAQHWIRDDYNGVVVDGDGFVDALVELVLDEPRLRRLGRQARIDACEHFGAQQLVERHLDLYASLATEPRYAATA